MVSSIPKLLSDRAAANPDAPFLTVKNDTWTYCQIARLTSILAFRLFDGGVTEGNVVACRLDNCIEYLLTWFACEALGAVFFPLNHLLPDTAAEKLLSNMNAQVLIVDDTLSTTSLQFSKRSAKKLLQRSEISPDSLTASKGIPDVVCTTPRSNHALPAKILTTSGTTGIPKAVIWSRLCEWTWAAAYGTELLPLESHDRVYSCLPLTHVTCQGTVAAALLNGAHAIIDPAFDPFTFWKRIRSHDVRMFTCVGTILESLASRPHSVKDANNPVERIVTAGTPPRIWKDFEQRFGCTIMETWGQTETASCWFMPRQLPMDPGTIGEPVESRFRIRIVNSAGTDASDGEDGELMIQPTKPHLMADRYVGDMESGSWNADGWYATGDIIRRESGAFRFRARTREVIRRHGEMIAPSLIEDVALSHPHVLNAAAVAVRDERFDGDEAIKLCIIPRWPAVWKTSSLTAYLSSRLDRRLLPTWISIYSEFPLTPSTRVRRVALAEDSAVRIRCHY